MTALTVIPEPFNGRAQSGARAALLWSASKAFSIFLWSETSIV